MLASEMKSLASQARNSNNGFQKQWEEMETRIKESARNGENKCKLVYGKYNEQLIEKLRENGFSVKTSMEIFPHISYGMTNCLTQWVLW